MTKSIEDAIEKVSESEKKISRFSDLLESLENTEDKKKLLWKEVYENALIDRENANILFTDLLLQSKGNPTQHATFGGMMSKYLERMAKSNDQILKLAELIAKEDQGSSLTPDDIFNKINEG